MLEETDRNAIPSDKFPSAFSRRCSHDPRACSKAKAVWMVKELDFERTANRTHNCDCYFESDTFTLHLAEVG